MEVKKNVKGSEGTETANNGIEPQDTRLWGLQQLADYVGVSINTVKKMVREGMLPQPCIGSFGCKGIIRWDAMGVKNACRRQQEIKTKTFAKRATG